MQRLDCLTETNAQCTKKRHSELLYALTSHIVVRLTPAISNRDSASGSLFVYCELNLTASNLQGRSQDAIDKNAACDLTERRTLHCPSSVSFALKK